MSAGPAISGSFTLALGIGAWARGEDALGVALFFALGLGFFALAYLDRAQEGAWEP